MSKIISLNNFLKMSPEAPQYTDRNQHYLISGANPTYYLDTSGTQEEQIAPLIASLDWKAITSSLDGNIIAMIPASISASYSIFLMTNTSQVYGITSNNGPTGIVSFGYPSGTAQVNMPTGKLTVVNNNIYAGLYNDNRLYYTGNLLASKVVSISIGTPAVITLNNHRLIADNQIQFGTSGTLPTGITAGTTYFVLAAGLTLNTFEISLTSGGAPINTSGTQSGVQIYSQTLWTPFITSSAYIGLYTYLEPFLEYCIINTTSSVIKKIDNSYSLLTGLNLGTGWNIQGFKNYNDKYLAIAAQLGNDFTNNCLFLWNGRDDTYNYSMKIPGKFVDMKVINSVLYVVVAINTNKTVVYQLSGTNLKEVFEPQYSKIDVSGPYYQYIDLYCLFNYQNNIGLRLTSNSDLTFPLMVYGNSPVGKSEFILTSGNQFNQIILGSDGILYACEFIPNGVSNLYYYPLTNTTSQPILYRSQWIPCKNAQGLDIIYDTPPQSGTDAINVTVYGDGEDIITGTSTTTLDAITPTNFLNQKRTRLDLKGFVGDKIKIELSTVNSTWRPIIREINLITQ